MTADEPQIIWQSGDGQSALYCGDGLALMAAMPPDSVDCIWTDPPYLLSNDGVTCVAGKRVSVNKGARIVAAGWKATTPSTFPGCGSATGF